MFVANADQNKTKIDLQSRNIRTIINAEIRRADTAKRPATHSMFCNQTTLFIFTHFVKRCTGNTNPANYSKVGFVFRPACLPTAAIEQQRKIPAAGTSTENTNDSKEKNDNAGPAMQMTIPPHTR
jgi:hypothetical protein